MRSSLSMPLSAFSFVYNKLSSVFIHYFLPEIDCTTGPVETWDENWADPLNFNCYQIQKLLSLILQVNVITSSFHLRLRWFFFQCVLNEVRNKYPSTYLLKYAIDIKVLLDLLDMIFSWCVLWNVDIWPGPSSVLSVPWVEKWQVPQRLDSAEKWVLGDKSSDWNCNGVGGSSLPFKKIFGVSHL